MPLLHLVHDASTRRMQNTDILPPPAANSWVIASPCHGSQLQKVCSLAKSKFDNEVRLVDNFTQRSPACVNHEPLRKK